MAEPTKKQSARRLKEPKDDTKKEVKVQSSKLLKEQADIERVKNHFSLSRNVALNRSFNTNSKLELLK